MKPYIPLRHLRPYLILGRYTEPDAWWMFWNMLNRHLLEDWPD